MDLHEAQTVGCIMTSLTRSGARIRWRRKGRRARWSRKPSKGLSSCWTEEVCRRVCWEVFAGNEMSRFPARTLKMQASCLIVSAVNLYGGAGMRKSFFKEIALNAMLSVLPAAVLAQAAVTRQSRTRDAGRASASQSDEQVRRTGGQVHQQQRPAQSVP